MLEEDEIRVWFADAPRREHTAAGRALLRRILGDVEIEVGANGKPRLRDSALHFNISHSGELVALAIARTAIGLDLERIRMNRDLLGIARRFFSPAELRRVEEDEHEFFAIWTMKEAVVKAIGSGVFGGLQSFTVPRDGGIVRGREEWSVSPLASPRDGYRAAIAMPSGRRWRVSCAPCAS